MGDLPDLANLDYRDRVNRAIDYVTRNLAQPLKLEQVARAAAFSPFHFHRIFKAIVGETLHDFVKRTRLERSLQLLAHGRRRSLTDIALECGFSSSSDYSRSFRAHFGVSPRAFDLDVWRRTRREAFVAGLPSKPPRLAAGDNPDGFTVRMRELRARRVAYLRVFEPYREGRVSAACEELIAWARERGLEHGQWLGYQWEDPEIVPLDQCRYDVALEVPEGVALGEAVSEGRFPATTVAEVVLSGPIELELRALEWLYTTWLPNSGLVPGDQPGFEAWKGLPFAHGSAHFELAVQLPVARPHVPKTR